MKSNLKRAALATLAVAMMALTLIGCSKKNGSSAGGNETASQSKDASQIQNLTVSTADVAASSQLTDQSIAIGFGTAIDSLTPFRSNTARNAPFFLQIYETLGVLNENKEFEPYVAKSWETKDNGFTYTITLNDNVYDSEGNHITSSDLVWFISESMKRALKPVYSKIESVTATGEYTFDVRFKTNTVGTFETMLSDTYVISQKAFEASKDEFATTAVTTSPYKVTEFIPSSGIKMERRADYWQDIEKMPECVRPLAKNVEYKIITEAFQMGVALETGTIDAVVDLASSTGAQFVGKTGFTIDLSDGPQGWQVYFSGADSSVVANNVKLRQAICYAIDANGLITALAGGYGTQMWDPASPRLLGFNEKWKSEDYYGYNPDKAKQLLKESGYNGEKITILSTSSAFASRLAQLLQNYLVSIGINCELNSIDMALYTAIRLDGSKYDMVINTVGGTCLADMWSIRFDPAAYKLGDATSRKDQTLAEMLYKTWTYEGWTEENVDAVHYYIKDNMYAYGLVNPQVFTIWSEKLNMQKVVKGGISGFVSFPSCQFSK